MSSVINDCVVEIIKWQQLDGGMFEETLIGGLAC